jgi:hypothetical protein
MKKAASIFLIVLALCFQSCKDNSHLPPIAYAQYMEDAGNDMVKAVDFGNLSYKVQLATPQYVVSKELGDQLYDESEFTKRLHELDGYTFFYISIESSGASKMTDPSFADARASYFVEAAASDISLKSGDDILKPVTYHFENNYGLTSYDKILVAFNTGQQRDQDFQLVFNDRFNENPLVKASFTTKSIAQLPTLEIK